MTDIQVWRQRALHVFLVTLSLGAMPVSIFVVIEALRQPARAAAAPYFLILYLLLVSLTLLRRLPHRVRVAGFLLIGYAVAIVALVRSGLIGDGRLYLLILPLLALILADTRFGAIAGAISLLIHLAFAFFARAGLLAQWVVVTENPMALLDWLTAIAAFLMMLGVSLTLMGLFNRTLSRSLKAERRSAREAMEASRRLEEQAAEQKRYIRWLEAAARVALEAGAETAPDRMLWRVARTVHEHPELLQVTIYTIGQDGSLTAQAHAGESVQEVSLIARAALQHRSPHAGRVGAEYELACPLRLGERALGVVAVRAPTEMPADGIEATVLTLVADQIALALEKARLFAQTQVDLQELEALYRRYTTRAWERFVQEAPSEVQLWTGVEQVPPGAWQTLFDQAHSSGRAVTGEENGRYLLAVPVKIRGIPIGVLGFHREPRAGVWRAEEVAMAEAVADRLALAVENARLLEEAQRRAAREHRIAEITAHLRASLDPDTILKTTVRELGQALRARWVAVEVTGPARTGGNPPDEEALG